MLLNPCGVGRTVLLRASAGGFYYFTSCLNAPVIPVWKKKFIYMLPINPIWCTDERVTLCPKSEGPNQVKDVYWWAKQEGVVIRD